MKRILQITTCNSFRGTEKQELEIFRNIDKDIVFDFLTPTDEPFKEYKKEIENLGGKVYSLNIKRNNLKNKLIYRKRLKEFFKNNNYDTIHINSSAFFFSLDIALIAKKYKIKKIIIHSHSVRKINPLKKLLITILNPILIHKTTKHLSCSKEAASFFYNKKYLKDIEIIKNGIEIDKYKFNEILRKKYIKEFKLAGNIVYGHVGQFDERKNHSFLIDIFNEIVKKEKNSILLLIGEGKLLNDIKLKVKELELSKKVIFLGFRNDVNEILNCMDIFIFSSIMEGLGTSVIEAQTNGLITFCSNKISNEANISPYFKRFNLEDSPSIIAKEIIENKLNDFNKRKNAYKFAKDNGYDIKDTCKKIKQIYLR